jgi:fluoride exporter
MRVALLIVFGSAGTLTRYALQGLVQHRSGSEFPFGTLAVNLAGCFLLGGVGTFALNRLWIPPDWRIAITIGFFGAFTTFSTFGWETVRMLENGEWFRALIYAGASVLGGLVLVRGGMWLGDRL